jgi:hypothetical protein
LRYTHYDSEQFIFDRTLSGLWGIGKLLFKVLAYLPLLMTGYMLADQFLEKDQAAVLWLTASGGFAVLTFLFIYFLKGMITGLREDQNYWCIPLLLICILYTCMVPFWWMFLWVDDYMLRLSPENGRIFTWIIAAGTAVYTYSRYNFFTDSAPRIALPLYRMGYELTKKFA